MDEHPNVAVLRQALDALNTGNMQAGIDLLADDVEWHEIGGAEFHGKAALAERYQSAPASDWEIHGEVHDIVANDDHAVHRFRRASCFRARAPEHIAAQRATTDRAARILSNKQTLEGCATVLSIHEHDSAVRMV